MLQLLAIVGTSKVTHGAERTTPINATSAAAIAKATGATAAPSKVELVITTLQGSNTTDLERLRAQPSVRKFAPVFNAGERKALTNLGAPHIAQAAKVTVDSEERARELEAWSHRSHLKLKFERNLIPLTLQTPAGAILAKPPGGRFFDRQWGLNNTGQIEALAIDDLTSLPIAGVPGEDIGVFRAPPEPMTSDRTITVAVLDTGVDYEVQGLQGQIVEKPSECKALAEYTQCLKSAGPKADAKKICDQKYANLDTDGNGYPLDCAGWNSTARPISSISQMSGDSDASDSEGHGTHVAGIIGAKADANGVRGVAQNVKILPVKVIVSSPTSPVRPRALTPGENTKKSGRSDLNSLPAPTDSNMRTGNDFGDLIARGLLYAIRSKAQIINMSLGWPTNVESHLTRQMIDLAQAQDILVVAAAGNDSTETLVRPCVYTGVICVASHDPNGAISNFSNFASGVDIAAPGMNILSTYPSKSLSVQFPEAVGFEIKSGTSMAAPFISGALARLLQAGISPKDAYARLMVGARPHLSSPIRPLALARQFTLSGNADLARAFSAQPVPLILPKEKDPIVIQWNRRDRLAQFSFNLKNFWIAPSSEQPISLRLELVNSVTTDARLTQTEWVFKSWQNQEVKSLTSALEILDSRVGSDLYFDLKIQVGKLEPKVIRLRAEIRVPVSKEFDDPEATIIPIVNGSQIAGTLLRSVSALDGQLGQDYIAISPLGSDWKLQLLRENSRYEISGESLTPVPKGELLLIQRLDLDFNGQSEYVFFFRNPPNADIKQYHIIMRFFDHDLKPRTVKLNGQAGNEIVYDNKVSPLPDLEGGPRWMKLGTQRVPAWVYRGTTPPLEKAAFDPWDPTPLDAPSYRFYYLSEDGLHSVSAPTDSTAMAMLTMSPGDHRLGHLPVLFSKGTGTNIEYEFGEFYDGKLNGFSPTPLPSFRALQGSDLKEVQSLDSISEAPTGTGFLTDSYRGSRRLTAFITNKLGTLSPAIDTMLNPLSSIDSITAITGIFMGEHRKATFTQTIYELQYTDIETQDSASISLRRFSFLPSLFFYKFFSAGVVTDTGGSKGPGPLSRLPAIFVPAGLGLTPGLEVVVPKYDRSNSRKLLGLERPAKLHLEAAKGCEPIANAVRATSQLPTQVVFYCGDKFIRIPLTY
jgi:subtilisin family serine protease